MYGRGQAGPRRRCYCSAVPTLPLQRVVTVKVGCRLQNLQNAKTTHALSKKAPEDSRCRTHAFVPRDSLDRQWRQASCTLSCSFRDCFLPAAAPDPTGFSWCAPQTPILSIIKQAPEEYTPPLACQVDVRSSASPRLSSMLCMCSLLPRVHSLDSGVGTLIHSTAGCFEVCDVCSASSGMNGFCAVFSPFPSLPSLSFSPRTVSPALDFPRHHHLFIGAVFFFVSSCVRLCACVVLFVLYVHLRVYLFFCFFFFRQWSFWRSRASLESE